MNRHRLICLSGLFLCLLTGAYLRLRGADWGSGAPRSHRGMYAHPDERSIYDKTGRLRWETVEKDPHESGFSHWKRTYSKNFLDPRSGMNLDSFNYGSFPYYVLFALSHLFNAYSPEQARSVLIRSAGSVYLLTFLVWGVFYLLSRSRSSWRGVPKKIAVFLVAWTGLFLAAYWLIPHTFTRGTPGPEWSYQNWGILARPLSGMAGVFTIFYVYRIGGRIYGRKTGLFAAILLTFTVLHLQLSHYFTFDVIQTFFCVAAIYSFLALVDAETWRARFAAMAAASLWTGLAMSTKFGSILLFIPWFVAWAAAFWKQRPKSGLFRWPTLRFSLGIKAGALLSFFLIWTVSFLTQPFGYLDYPNLDQNRQPVSSSAPSPAADLSFIHFNFAAGPKVLPQGLRDRLARLGERIEPFTGPFGLHFGWLKYHRVPPREQEWIAIGGSRYWRDVSEQKRMALQGGFPWTRQYKNTVPFLYQWKNLIFWGMGVPLGLLCLMGLFFGFLKPLYRPTWLEWIVLAWMVPNFFTTHLFHTKFPRYLTPQLPFFVLWAAALAIGLTVFLRQRERRRGRGGFRLSGVAAAASLAVVVWSALYSFAYLEIYTGVHTWERASDWFQEEVQPGKRIVTETWDDSVPTDPGVMQNFQHQTTNPIHSDSPQHLRTVCGRMEWADYYCFSSKRNYGAFLQAPEDGPNRVRFYKSLFAGNLGYRLVKTFSQPVYVLGIPIRFELADESLSLYDHPTVHIFEKTEDLDREEILQRILHPPKWIDHLTKEQVLTSTEHRSILAPPATYALERWLLGVLLVGWLFWPVSFVLFRSSPDGGLFASKTVGILLLTYLSWFGSHVGWWRNTRLATTLALLVWLGVSAVLVYRAWPRMIDYLRSHWRKAIFAESVFLLVFAYFISVRMANPDIYWGEKPMNIAFINAAYRAPQFPAIDPWFAGAPINYYHYGHFAIGIFGRWVGVPPEYAYNLACGTWPALVFCLVLGMVFNLTRSKLAGLIAGFLATMAGNGKSLLQLASSLPGGPMQPKVFRETYVPQGLGHYFSDVFDQIGLAFGQVGIFFWRSPLYHKVWEAFGAWIDPASNLEAAKTDALQRTLSFDAYFWKLSRITKSSVANEFPAWTHFFADLHAHQIGMPIAMVTLALMVSFFQRRVGGWTLRQEGRFDRARSVYGSSLVGVLQVLAIGLFLGIVFVSNAWDFPGLFGFFALGLVLCFGLYYKSWFSSVRWGFGRSVLHLGLGERWIVRAGILKLGVLREILVPVLAVGVLSRVFLFPFHRYFHPPERVGGVGWMHEAASGWTTPYEFLQIFGFFLILILLGYACLYWRWGTTVRLGWIRVWVALVLSALMAIFLTHLLRGWATGVAAFVPEAPIPKNRDSLAFWRYLDSDIAYITFGGVFFLLLLLLPFALAGKNRLEDRLGAMILGLGLAVIAGVEVLYINEGWGPPLHRWNTAFKFHLQAWLCLSIGAGWLLGTWWTPPADRPSAGYRVLGRLGRYALGYPILLFTLALASLFPLVAPFIFTHAEGSSFRTRHVEGDFTLDGLNFMRKKHPDYAAVVDFLRSETQGQPTILEVDGLQYVHDRAWIATHTGLPALIGWVQHIRERDHRPEPRIEQVKTVYTSLNRKRVRDILREHQVRFVIVGPGERKIYPDVRGLAKFDEWKDLFYPVFSSRLRKPGVTVYAVHPAYQLDEDWTPPKKEEKENTFFRKESGRPLLRGGIGYGGGEYREPRGIVVTRSGETLVADSMNHRIQAFDAHGNLKWVLGERGEQVGEFNEPRDLAVDEIGKIHVLDTWNSRVQVFGATGDLVQVYSVVGGANGIAVGRVPIAVPSPEGRGLVLPDRPRFGAKMTFIANTAGRSVVVINRRGQQTQSWGRGNLLEPVDVEITPRGLAVADARARKIWWFDGRGRLLDQWEIPTLDTGNQTNELKIVWDPNRKRLLLTDPAQDRLFVFSEQGQPVLDTPVRGGPSGVAVAGDGRVFVTVRQEGRVALVPLPSKN